MEDQSFREILSQFLEEESAGSPLKNGPQVDFKPVFEPQTPSFHWQSSKPHRPAKGHYPPPVKRATKHESPVKPVPPEVKWQIAELNHADQQHIKGLVQLGANEINGEISLTSLKKAYRRLARTFHPDVVNKRAGNDRPEQFLLLQSIYERLSRSLKARAASESAGDNESVSAEGYRRQDAA